VVRTCEDLPGTAHDDAAEPGVGLVLLFLGIQDAHDRGRSLRIDRLDLVLKIRELLGVEALEPLLRRGRVLLLASCRPKEEQEDSRR
jgi:hypothetical protein